MVEQLFVGENESPTIKRQFSGNGTSFVSVADLRPQTTLLTDGLVPPVILTTVLFGASNNANIACPVKDPSSCWVEVTFFSYCYINHNDE